MIAQQASDQPAVSVVVPVYNRRDLVCRTIRSLLNQNFGHPYEIVVVDDGSSDGTAEAVAGMDGRIRVIRQRNRGAAAARWGGIEAARAPLVAFQDSDDVAYPNKLSCLWSALQDYPQAILAFGLANICAWQRVRLARGIDCRQDGRRILIEDPLPVLLRYRTIISCMNLMTYRWAALKGGRVSSFYKASNDYCLHLGLARYGPFVCVDRALCDYHSEPNGISSAWGEERQLVFALYAADAAYRRSRSREALVQAIRARMEEEGPDTAVKLSCFGDWRMLARMVPILLRHTRWYDLPRRLWWSLDQVAIDNPRAVPVWLKGLVQAGRTLRRKLPSSRRRRFGKEEASREPRA